MGSGEGSGRAYDKGNTYRLLAKLYGYSPQEIADMTPTQQRMMLETGDTTEDGTPVLTFRTEKEYQEWLAKIS